MTDAPTRSLPTRRAVLALIGGTVLVGAAAPRYTPQTNARLFDRVWNEVDRRYWDRARLGTRWNAAAARYRPQALTATDAAALYAVLDAMLALVGDSHVYARASLAVLRDAADAAGTDSARFGMTAWPLDGTWRVLTVRPGGPAAQAGVRPGWAILSIDGRPVDNGWRPQAGQQARFLFRDDGDRARTLAIGSALLPPDPPRRATRLPGDVLLLGFDLFEDGVDRWIAGEIAAASPAALVLDLRDNEGGDALAVARVAGLLFPAKRTLLTRVARGRTLAVPVAGAGRRSFSGPLALLVGPRSASGAEILAALVQDSGRGRVVGETTAGAVTGAARTALPDGGELWVAVFDIRTTAGVRLEARGLVPDFPVRQSLADLRAGTDPVLARALSLLAPAFPVRAGT